MPADKRQTAPVDAGFHVLVAAGFVVTQAQLQQRPILPDQRQRQQGNHGKPEQQTIQRRERRPGAHGTTQPAALHDRC